MQQSCPLTSGDRRCISISMTASWRAAVALPFHGRVPWISLCSPEMSAATAARWPIARDRRRRGTWRSVSAREFAGDDFAAIDQEYDVQHVARVGQVGLRQHDREPFLLESADHFDQPLTRGPARRLRTARRAATAGCRTSGPRKRGQLLLAAGELQRLALCEDLRFGNDRIDESSRRAASALPLAHAGSSTFSSTVRSGTSRRSSGM